MTVTALDILHVRRLLGGGELRGKRGRAFWRNGDGYNVSLDQVKGVFYDRISRPGTRLGRLISSVVCAIIRRAATPGMGSRGGGAEADSCDK